MSPEEMFEIKRGWAEGQARKRHSKHKALLEPHLLPSLEEYTNCALSGLWIACREWQEVNGLFTVFAYGKICNEFTWLRRQYGRYETNKDNFQHGSSRDVDRILDRQSEQRPV